MPHRCLLLSHDTAAGAAAELRAKVRSALGVEVFTSSLDGDPSATPTCSFALLRLPRLRKRSELLECLTALSKFSAIPSLAVCDPSLTRWISDIAQSGIDDFLFEPYADEELRVRV